MDYLDDKNIPIYKNEVTRDVIVKEQRGKFHVFMIDPNTELRNPRTYGLIAFEDGTFEWVYKAQIKFTTPD